MTDVMNINLGQTARDLSLPIEKVQTTVELLDEGNTVPFITRYRKDRTGGLDEEQISRIQDHIIKLRMLAERKATILKSIESQGKLTEELTALINEASSPKRLEDLYLPYKPKKQTLAATARERGLEPLAREIYHAEKAAADIAARAADFVSADKKLPGLADVLQGTKHLLAEQFSEHAELRGRLRKMFWRDGKLACAEIPLPKPLPKKEEPKKPTATKTAPPATAPLPTEETPPTENADVPTATEATPTDESSSPAATEATPPETPPPVDTAAETPATEAVAGDAANPPQAETTAEPTVDTPTVDTPTEEPAAETPAAKTATPVAAESATPATEEPNPAAASTETVAAAAPVPKPPAAPKPTKKAKARELKKTKKELQREKLRKAFTDYYNYQEPVTKIPPHRILAINRGERAKVLRVKFEVAQEAIVKLAEELLIPADHPHAEFLRECVGDALTRLLMPSLEREIRRELTERAEDHAVEVFAQNLRKLLLQPPVHDRRVLAIDPGYRSGCKMAVLDQFGNILGHGVFHVIGKGERVKQSREKFAAMIRKHQVSVVAIGNGTACRETEQLVTTAIGEELKDLDVSYVIVNEAGASVYSTSPLGREELPKCDAVQRSAVSIGRRLLDPLSELVKINAANIGVGMYQHDVKSKHLSNSLDAVVGSCVNYVGVDVNSASPSLLKYVSGLNQLTARRLYEHRQEHGPFRSREQLKEVSGLGEASFVQSAGFLKIAGGDNPLDATWIHPESYDAAQSLLKKLDCSVSDLVTTAPVVKPTPAPSEPPAEAAPTKEPPAAETSATETPDAQKTASPTEATVEPTPAASESTAKDSTEVTQPAVEQATVEQPAEPPSDPSAEPTPEPVATTDPEPQPVEPPAVAVAATVTIAPKTVVQELVEKTSQVDFDKMAEELKVGKLLLRDLLSDLTRPGRDRRNDFPPPVFRRGIVKLEDLEAGMELSGTVLNVVDFGAFVDIGLSDSGLVHISRLADRYVSNPHEVVSVGETLKVWVVEIDKKRRRVSLTAIKPGSEKPRQPARQKQTGSRPSGGKPKPSGRKPSGDRRGGKRVGKPKFQQSYRPKPKPKPVKPITKAMVEGKEPMRAFSDLQQFFTKKTDGDEKSEKEQSKKPDKPKDK